MCRLSYAAEQALRSSSPSPAYDVIIEGDKVLVQENLSISPTSDLDSSFFFLQSMGQNADLAVADRP